MEEKKILVTFPGVGYTNDKPLLYYTVKLAKNKGYDVVMVSYQDIPRGLGGNEQKMREAFINAFSQAMDQTSNIKWDDYDRIVFAGKSIGTVVAGSLADKLDVTPRFLYYTPVSYTFPYAKEESGIVFHGTADPWVDTELVKSESERLKLPLYLYENANHSLETPDVMENIDIIKRVMEITDKVL